ncbi:hypothetical protein [Actinoplanes xinjiangensis]|uniref:Lipoprotein LprG n=1 Tax=Actinoplanes xinjiangensis TaxID=512350 RepID=A0A316FGR6_9ACTN|nr:hypothetical protein [Actinoplanes xinjiangensis]PWK46960.1 hypothetical protein BC793_10874 [Actinoplanes xinjiangensis]GIF40118.1 hypothetical protein Axi01nite_44290 [Actinoplanes xinjiangensis]
MRTIPTKAALIVLAVAATTLAGCQSEDKTVPTPPPSVAPTASPASNGIKALSATEILKRAKAALREAKSFRAEGMLHQDGEKALIDLKVSGLNFIASVSFGKATVELLSIGGKRYLRPNKQFWIMSTNTRQGTILAQAMGDRWVAGADKDPAFVDLFAIGSLDGLFRPTRFDIGAVKEIAGVEAVGLMDFDDIEKKLFVAATGKPYPLQLTGKSGAELAFTDFGATITGLVAPPGSRVVNIAELAG